jgi:pyruvate,water dikinase
VVLESVKKCFASLFTPRATSYREDMGFGHFDVGLSVGVQKMVRADRDSSGVIFTLDTETGFRDVVLITSPTVLVKTWSRVGWRRTSSTSSSRPARRLSPPDWKRLGTKELRMVYDESGSKLVKNIDVPMEERDRFSITR